MQMKQTLSWISILIGLLGLSAKKYDTNIVGGQEVTQQEFPYLVALYNKEYGGAYCGGTLIAKNWVLTAAHCVDGDYAQEVWIGAHSMIDGENNKDFSVEKIHVLRNLVHANYNPGTTEFDFALLQLDEESKYTPIQINEKPLDFSKNITGTVTGWGALKKRTNDYPDTPRKVTLPITPYNECNKKESYGGKVTENMFCAGFKDGRQDACDGDSGGPFIIYENGKSLLAGVVSWGDGCATPEKYGVYSRVDKVTSWIKTMMGRFK